jgi:hypothetical protein
MLASAGAVNGRALQANGRAPSRLRRAPKQAVSGDLTPQIAGEIYRAMENLDADAELLAIVGSWRDTLDDRDVLSLLKEYNAAGRVLRRRQ